MNTFSSGGIGHTEGQAFSAGMAGGSTGLTHYTPGARRRGNQAIAEAWE